MIRARGWIALCACLLVGVAGAAEPTVKTTTTAPPQDLKDPVRQLLGDQAIQVSDEMGKPLGTFWFRKEIPVKATAEQFKSGLTYHEMEDTTLIGAVRFEQTFNDYRKQKIKPGVYTLRYSLQPMDGDHMGTAPYSEFCLLVPAARDPKPDLMEAKQLQENSARSTTGSHPAIMLLFPAEKPEAAPKIVDKGNGNFVLSLKEPVEAGGQKGELGIALTVVGHTTAE